MRRRCDECENEFEPYREFQRFCTEWCRREWHHRRDAQIRRWWLEREQERDEQQQQVEHPLRSSAGRR